MQANTCRPNRAPANGQAPAPAWGVVVLMMHGKGRGTSRMTLGVLGCALLLASPVASAAQASYSGASGECWLVVLERTLSRTEPALRCTVSHSGTVQVAEIGRAHV